MTAVAASLPQLQRWMPWARTAPTAEEELAVLVGGQAAFDADDEWAYMIYEPGRDELVGGAALHRRPRGTLEIGYWVRSDCTGRGYATAAARALTEAGFAFVVGADQIEIHMDEANVASAAIPPKLGYRLERHEERDILTSGHTGRGFVWVLDRPA